MIFLALLSHNIFPKCKWRLLPLLCSKLLWDGKKLYFAVYTRRLLVTQFLMYRSVKRHINFIQICQNKTPTFYFVLITGPRKSTFSYKMKKYAIYAYHHTHLFPMLTLEIFNSNGNLNCRNRMRKRTYWIESLCIKTLSRATLHTNNNNLLSGPV